MSASAPITISIGTGICSGHPLPIPMTGIIITGLTTLKIENKDSGQANVSIVLGYCGHVGIVIDGAPKVIIGNNQKARIGSNFVGVFSGVIVSGNSKVMVGS